MHDVNGESPWEVVVVGAGAAGLLSAARAAERGRRVLLLEKNHKPGVKILMSGGTRCNLTHATDARGIVEAFGPPGRFLHSALAALGPGELVALIEAEGVRTKVEATGKIFPVSDRAADVLEALMRRFRRSGAQLALGEPVVEFTREGAGFRLATTQQSLAAERMIVTTGGQSYPRCGTSGDGFRWAAAVGHTVVKPHVALTPITTGAAWVPLLKGITMPDVLVSVVPGGAAPAGAHPRPLAECRGSLLFAHFGLSGPAALNVSRAVSAQDDPRSVTLACDFLPGTSARDLESQVRQEIAASGRRQVTGILAERLPHRLAETLAGLAGLSADCRAAEFSNRDRVAVVAAIKEMRIPVTGTLGFAKAEVTAGGVALEEIDSRTMQSKRVPNLYFAGEVLDLDGPIGGYNFQAAFSTGWLAGESV
jgi:predicted Rossmann fold flavoprotein